MIDFWAAGCTADGSCTPSAGAAWIPILLVVLTIGFGVLSWRIASHARRADRGRSTVIAALVGGLAILCVFLTLSTFRHIGGNTEVGDGGSAYACEAWWYQVGTPRGATDGDDQPSRSCRQAALDAIAPAIAESCAVGAVGGAALFRLFNVRRRRFDRDLAAIAANAVERD